MSPTILSLATISVVTSVVLGIYLTPVTIGQEVADSFVGGVMIGTACASLLFLTGRVAGFSSIIGTVLFDRHNFQFRWKATWLITFIVVGASSVVVSESTLLYARPSGGMACGMFLIGFGVRLARGCTSGHGIMGLSRLSLRSLVATAIFMGVGMLTSTSCVPITVTDTVPGVGRLSLTTAGILLCVYTFLAIVTPTRRDVNGRINVLNLLATATSAALFAVGLLVSRMHDPQQVNRFLKLNHHTWSPGLLITFLSATGVTTIAMRLRPTLPIQALCERAFVDEITHQCRYTLPTKLPIDIHLVGGSIAFGVGWGLSGVCPSTIPLRLGMGDIGVLSTTPLLMLGYLVAQYVGRWVVVRSAPGLIMHAFFEPTSASISYVVGDPVTLEVAIIDSVMHSSNSDIPTLRVWGSIWICEEVSRQEALVRFIQSSGYHPRLVLNSHMHVDHLTANTYIRRRFPHAQSALPSYEGTNADVSICDGTVLSVSDTVNLHAHRTPGHTEKCHTLILQCLNKSYAFTGDTLMLNTVGRTDLNPFDDDNIRDMRRSELYHSIQTIVGLLNDDDCICPAHAYDTTSLFAPLYEVRRRNRFLVHKSAHDFSESLKAVETTLAHFEDTDITFCITRNQMCGAIDGISVQRLDELYDKDSGACG